jgi:D-tyrosyl-tRNA(Tyr) deacylase
MNLSVTDIQGEVLIVPQFTLVADTKRGLRPNFSKGMPPDKGKILFKELQQSAINLYKNSSFGTFGADMNINLFNDGPVTFLLSSH